MSLNGELRARILRCVKAELDHGVLADAVPGTSDYDLAFVSSGRFALAGR